MDNTNAKIAQILSLETGKGLQYLVNEAYKIFGNPLFLHNMEYEKLALSENVVTDDWLWNEIVENGVFSEETIKFFMEECFIDAVANSKTITLLTSDKLKYERLYGRVFNCYNNTVADLIALGCDKPFSAQDAVVFETIGAKLSQEIRTSEFFKRYGIIYHENLICKLLDADIDDKAIYSGHLSNLYEDLMTNIYVVAVEISECADDKSRLADIRDYFKEMQPELKYAVYSNYIVIIASNEETELDIRRDLPKLWGCFNDNNVRTGISGGFDNLFNLRKHYNEAVDSLKQSPEGEIS